MKLQAKVILKIIKKDGREVVIEKECNSFHENFFRMLKSVYTNDLVITNRDGSTTTLNHFEKVSIINTDGTKYTKWRIAIGQGISDNDLTTIIDEKDATVELDEANRVATDYAKFGPYSESKTIDAVALYVKTNFSSGAGKFAWSFNAPLLLENVGTTTIEAGDVLVVGIQTKLVAGTNVTIHDSFVYVSLSFLAYYMIEYEYSPVGDDQLQIASKYKDLALSGNADYWAYYDSYYDEKLDFLNHSAEMKIYHSDGTSVTESATATIDLTNRKVIIYASHFYSESKTVTKVELYIRLKGWYYSDGWVQGALYHKLLTADNLNVTVDVNYTFKPKFEISIP